MGTLQENISKMKKANRKVHAAVVIKSKKVSKLTAEKMFKDSKQKYAVKKGQDYFDHVKRSLQCAIHEVERHEEHWKKAVAGGSYPDGRPLPKSNIVHQIEWCTHYIEQLSLHNDKAIRACVKLTDAFDIDMF